MALAKSQRWGDPAKSCFQPQLGGTGSTLERLHRMSLAGYSLAGSSPLLPAPLAQQNKAVD